MKSRFLILMMGLLMVLAIGADAYAQATFTVSSGNTPRGRMNGHAELAGGVTLAQFSGTCRDRRRIRNYRLRRPHHE